GDLTGDGIADIVLGLNQNGSRFLVFRGGDLALIAAFRVGTGNGFLGRTSVAIGDLDGNGRDDLIVSALYGNRTRVAGFNGESFDPGATRTRMFSAFALGGKYTKGAYLAAGDVNGDGKADVVLGSTSAVVVKAFSGADLTESNIHTRIAAFGPLGGVSKGGVRVAVRDLNGDGVGDIITASGELVSAFAGGANLPPAGTPSLLFAFDPEPTTLGGAWVG
ncbi:MAG TPA: VCBS repeat-containing protein, partial [Gemmata sp.]|nr:VCBS repeat-containing protein [Gemmata sp.]